MLVPVTRCSASYQVVIKTSDAGSSIYTIFSSSSPSNTLLSTLLGSLLIPANSYAHLLLLACDSHSFATTSSLLSYSRFERAHTSQYGFPRPAVRWPDCRRHGCWRWSWSRIRRLLRQPRRERRCERPRWELQGRGQGLRCKSSSLQFCQRRHSELAMRAFGVFSFGALGGMM